MSDELPPCPACASVYAYEMGSLLVCPECAHEWSPTEDDSESVSSPVIKDASGNVLADGDTVTIIKDLKVKGASKSIKVGTKVAGIRLVDGPDGHDIDAKVPEFGQMFLKSSIVKKVN